MIVSVSASVHCVRLPCFWLCIWRHQAIAFPIGRRDVQVAGEDASEVQRLAKAVAAAEEEQAPLQKQLAPLQQKAAALEERIGNAGGAPLRKQKEAVAGLQEVRAEAQRSIIGWAEMMVLPLSSRQDGSCALDRQQLPCTALRARIPDYAVI